MDLLSKIKTKQAVVGIIGLGYVGLPLVLRFCEVGFEVLGFDTDASKVERLNRGERYIKHIASSRLAALLTPREGAGQFAATNDLGRLGEPDVLLICVPTPLTSKPDPDLQLCRGHDPADCRLPAPRTADLFGIHHLPGHDREDLLPILAESRGRDGIFFLVFSPEREDPGNPPSGRTPFPRWWEVRRPLPGARAWRSTAR